LAGELIGNKHKQAKEIQPVLILMTHPLISRYNRGPYCTTKLSPLPFGVTCLWVDPLPYPPNSPVYRLGAFGFPMGQHGGKNNPLGL
jgi:hypothetical protein